MQSWYVSSGIRVIWYIYWRFVEEKIILTLSCFCKSAIGCAICTKQGSSGYCSHPCSLHRGFPPGHRLYIAFHIVQLRLYYVVSCQSFARYIMKLHFHVNHISRRWLPALTLRLPPIFDSLGSFQTQGHKD